MSGKDPITVNQCLQEAINEASAWFSSWLLQVIALKSAAVLFRTKRMPSHTMAVSVDGTSIPQKPVHRHLGLHLDEHLSWSAHTSTVANKVSSKLGLMFRLRKQLTATVKSYKLKPFLSLAVCQSDEGSHSLARNVILLVFFRLYSKNFVCHSYYVYFFFVCLYKVKRSCVICSAFFLIVTYSFGMLKLH